MDKTKELIEYFDIFGIKPGFYVEGKFKLYTLLGGLLSITSIIISIIIFIFFSLDDFKRNSPNITSSAIPQAGYRKIKFGEEKIWIPMRIADYYEKFLNHEGIIYPIIKYEYAERTNVNEAFEIKTQIVDLKLCNETSMKNMPEIYSLDVPLEQLYCIDMDNLIMGGSWKTTFINYIEADFYFCKNGVDYNKTNKDCTTKEEIQQLIGIDNSLEIELYFPEVQFQPKNDNTPVIISYKQYFYQISKYSNKIDNLYLQEYVFSDDHGWLINKVKNYSYWGFSTVTGDSYCTNEKKDLFNEGSTSRFYSLNIYLNPGIIFYERKYKKLTKIFAEGLPIMYIIFLIFKNIAIIFKLTEENKMLIELLFENLKEKPNNLENHFNKIRLEKIDNLAEPQSPNNINQNNDNIASKSNLNEQKSNNNFQPKISEISNTSNLNLVNKSPNLLSVSNDYFQNLNKLNLLNLNKKQKNEDKSYLNMFRNSIIFYSFNSNPASSNKVKYIAKQLFPYRYYFFSSFCKNSNIKKDNYFVSNKFAKVFRFLSQMIDISTYIVLQREFNILKTEFLDDKKINIIEKNKKINVGAHGFIRDINQCLDSKNFHIFGLKNLKK